MNQGDEYNKPITEEALDKLLKELKQSKKTFSLVAYCTTRKHVVDYGDPWTYLCGDPKCYWCSELKKGMKEQAKKMSDEDTAD